MLSISSYSLITETYLAAFGARMLGNNANQGSMGMIKKLDNFVGQMKGAPQQPSGQQMPPPVPSQPVNTTQQQQPQQRT